MRSALLAFLALALTTSAQANPRTQSDLYIWAEGDSTPQLDPFVEDAGAYHLEQRIADKATTTTLYAALDRDLPGSCRNSKTHPWPIYSYDLGSDGRLYLLSCRADSVDMWTVYYRIPPKQAPELLRFPVPVLDQSTNPPRVLRVEAQALLLNSEILQRRILSTSSRRDLASTSPRMEWIWKQGQGLVLHRYTLNTYGEKGGAVDSQVLIGPK